MVLCLTLLVSVVAPGVMAADVAVLDTSSKTPLAVVYAASDFQPYQDLDTDVDDVSAGQTVMNAIIEQMQSNGYENNVTGAIFCGDYSKTADSNGAESGLELSNAGLAAVHNVLNTQWGLGYDDVVYVQGNHDNAGTTNLDPSGANDSTHYGVYVLHEDDFCWKQANNDANGSIVKATAKALEKYLSEKVEQKYSKPIFVASHVPLHFSTRTATKSDNIYAQYIFDVLNKYAKELNIFFLFGHNHSGTNDDYLGGGSIYLPVGDKILIPDEGSTTSYTEYELNFSYMNPGYLGYYKGALADDGKGALADDGLSSSVFTIYDDRVVVERFDQSGKVNLKNAGALDTSNDTWAGAAANKDVYGSTLSVYLKEFPVSVDMGNLTSGILDKGSSETVTLKGEAGHTYQVEWASSNVGVVSVAVNSSNSMSATLTGVSNGNATITALATEVNSDGTKGKTHTVRFSLEVVTKVPSAVVMLFAAEEAITYFNKVDSVEYGTNDIYLIVDKEDKVSWIGDHIGLHYSAGRDPENEGDTQTTNKKQEINGATVTAFQLPVGSSIETIIFEDNKNLMWNFDQSTTEAGEIRTNIRTLSEAVSTYKFLSVSEGYNNYLDTDSDQDRIRLVATKGTQASLSWYYSTTYGLRSGTTKDGFRFILFYDQAKTDFSVYRVNHDGSTKDDSGATPASGATANENSEIDGKYKLESEQADSRVYLFKQKTNTIAKGLSAQLDDMTGYVNKGASNTAQTGDYLHLVNLNKGTSLDIPITVDMLSIGSDAFSASKAGTYTGLTVTYAGKVVTTDYTMIVRDTVTLLENDAKIGRMDNIYKLVTTMDAGREYLIADSNQPGIAHAMGVLKEEVSAHNVLIQELPVDGKNVLYIDATRYSSTPDTTTAGLTGRKIVDQGDIGSKFDADTGEASTDYKKAIRLVWSPTQRIFPADGSPEYYDVRTNNWYFLQNLMVGKYLDITGNNHDCVLGLFEEPLVAFKDTEIPESTEPDFWWYQWTYSDSSGMHLNRSHVKHAELLYSFHNYVPEGGTASGKDFQTNVKNQPTRRVWIYERVTDIDVISARMNDTNFSGSVVEDHNGSSFTGSYLMVDTTHADGRVTTEQVPITTSMLSGDYDLNEAGKYENLTVTYQGKIISQKYTLNVTAKTESDYPEFPDEGAVRIDKNLDTTKFDYFASGAASIDLSVTGIPGESGIDLVIILDASSSMQTCVHGTRLGSVCPSYDADAAVGTADGCPIRMVLLEAALENMLRSMKTPVNGYIADIEVAIASFNGYTPINSDYELNWEADYEATNAGGSKTHEYFQQCTDDRFDASEILLEFTDIADVEADVLNKNDGNVVPDDRDIEYSKGTNYDRAMELAYDLMKEKQDLNALNGETRHPIVVFMSDGAPYQYNYFHGDANLDAWDEYLTGTLDDVAAGTLKGDAVDAGNTKLNAAYFSAFIPTDTEVKAVYDKYYHTEGKHWMAEAIKGDPNTKYKVIDPDAMTVDHITEVNGLGATMYTIGFGLGADYNVTSADCTAVLHNMVTSSEYHLEANDGEALERAFTQIAGVLRKAGDAVFTDQMGPMFDLITSNKHTWGSGENAKTLTFNPAPSIEVKRYQLYKHGEIGQILNFTDANGVVSSVMVTEDMVGTRKPVAPTIIETVTFNDDGTAAYSTAVGGGTTNILSDGVICAATFWYNTDVYNTKEIKVSEGEENEQDVYVTLQTECFYWNVGDIPQDELVLRYDVYLIGSMESTRGEGIYDTNTHAELNYTNYLSHACEQSVPTPKLPWGQATVGYGFYLVDANGNPIINQTSGETGSFEQAVKLSQPTYESFMLNASAQITAGELVNDPSLVGYNLFDSGAGYVVTANSTGTGSYTISTGNASGVKQTTYVVGVADTAVTGTGTVTTSDHATVNTVVWFAVTAKVGCVPDSVVIDFGLSVDMDVMTNDTMFGNLGSLAYIGKADAFAEGYATAKAEDQDLLLWEYLQSVVDEDAAFTSASVSGTYGTAKLENGKVRYTLNESNGMQMKQEEVFVYAVEYKGAAAPGYYYSTVTVIPATVIYYEDNFVDHKTYQYITDPENSKKSEDYRGTTASVVADQWTNASTGLDRTQAEDRPGSFSLSTIDANNIYGFDSAYKNLTSYSMGTALKFTTSDVANTNTLATLTNANGKVLTDVDMTGTYTRTYGTAEFTFNGTGFDVISLTSNTTGFVVIEVKDESGNIVLTDMVDTYYGYKWAQVDTNNDSVPDTYQWVPDTSASGALYQVPVIKVNGLTYGKYTATITVSYNNAFDHYTGDGRQYDFYLDAIRIYDPANDGNNSSVIQDAYVADGEGWPEYFELRNMVISKDTFDSLDTDTIPGIIFIDNTADDKGDVDDYKPTVSDYYSYGPNNELYLAPSQAVTFKLNVDMDVNDNNVEDVAAIHLALKNVGGGTAYAKVHNVLMTGIPYSTMNTATDLYYDITVLNGKDVLIANSPDSDAVVSITNIKVTYKSEHTDSESVTPMEIGLCTVDSEIADQAISALVYAERAADGLDTDAPAEVVIPTLTMLYPSLSFESEVRYNLYYSAENVEDVVEMGLLTFDSELTDGTIADAVDIIPGYYTAGEFYGSRTNGIPAKNLGDKMYFKSYAKLSDGSYAYSNMVCYNAVGYAKDILANSKSSAMKSLVTAMLNYGAAAQQYFGYKTDALMNACLTDEQKLHVEAYRPDMVEALVAADRSKTVNFTAVSESYAMFAPSVSFEGAFAVNYYLTPGRNVDGDLKFYYWNLEDYLAADILSTDNATGYKVMTSANTNGTYVASVEDIAAKQIDQTVFVTCVYESGGVTYCTGVVA